jgi:hypothetical protein
VSLGRLARQDAQTGGLLLHAGVSNMNTKFTRKAGEIDRPPLQSRQEVVINAPLERVWSFNQDLTRIAEYHPRVNRVELLSGQRQRGAGVAYMCHLKDGKNTCVEIDLEVVPMRRIVTALPEDTMGLSKIFPDYIVESTLDPIDQDRTRVAFAHFYSTKSLKAKLVNIIARPRIAKESADTLNAIKRAVEEAGT